MEQLDHQRVPLSAHHFALLSRDDLEILLASLTAVLLGLLVVVLT